MIECPSCGKKHRPGTLFCSDCGIYLPTGGTLRTTPLPTDQLPRTSTPPRETVTPGEREQRALVSLKVRVLESDRTIQLPATAEVLLGREDAAHGIFPDLDLAPDRGLERGVSRRHAKVLQRGGEVYVEDVGSANGTFLNGQRLTPYLPYPVKDGDELQVGQLRLKVNLQ